jgi:hypothetical protein
MILNYLYEKIVDFINYYNKSMYKFEFLDKIGPMDL